jgi:hypothetical protein
MPIDFIDQLSKFEKSPCKHKNAVCNCGRFRIGEYRFRIKRFGSCLMMVKKSNILMRQNHFRQQQRKTISADCFRIRKKHKFPLRLTKKEN